MKIKKILALALALISVMTMLVGCGGGTGSETTPEMTMPPEDPSKTAKANLIFMDIDGKVLYDSFEEDEEMYVFTSAYLDPTILNFVEDYCYMNDGKVQCKIDSKTNVLKTITIVNKKGNVDYTAGSKKYTIESTGKKVDTYWLCYIDGKELETSIDETIVTDGSTIILRLVYVGQDIKL